MLNQSRSQILLLAKLAADAGAVDITVIGLMYCTNKPLVIIDTHTGDLVLGCRAQGLWRIEYLNTGYAKQPEDVGCQFGASGPAPQVGVVVAN